MIKNFIKFNESKDVLSFWETDEWKSLFKKYNRREDIIDHLHALEDSDFTYDLLQNFNYKSDILTIKSTISISKSYNKSYNVDQYQEFLKLQSKDIDYLKTILNRMAGAIGMEKKNSSLIRTPFSGPMDSSINKDPMMITFYYDMDITDTDELKSTKDKFQLTPSKIKDAFNIVVKKLVDGGIPEEDAIKLLDLSPDYTDEEYIYIGFITDDQIRAVAGYDKRNDDLDFNNSEISGAIEDYKGGYCDEYL